MCLVERASIATNHSASMSYEASAPYFSQAYSLVIGGQPAQVRIHHVLLGEGNFGTVWEGELSSTSLGSHLVAVKTLKETAPEESKEAFMREVRIAQYVEHPNVMGCLTLFQAPDQKMYAVMKRAEKNLEDYLNLCEQSSAPIRPGALAIIDGDIRCGLKHMHKLGVVHCDAHPGNILLAEGVAKLADFGLSNDRSTLHDKLGTSSTIGKLMFVSFQDIQNVFAAQNVEELFQACASRDQATVRQSLVMASLAGTHQALTPEFTTIITATGQELVCMSNAGRAAIDGLYAQLEL